MSSIYDHLAEELKAVEKGKYTIPSMEQPPQNNFPSLRFTGLKIAVGFAFFLSLAAFAGAISFYQALNHEIRKRKSLEAAQVQIQEKASQLETVTEQYRAEIDRMREQLSSSTLEREELNREIEEGRNQAAQLQTKIQQLEERNRTVEEQIKKLNEPSPAPAAALPYGASFSDLPAEPFEEKAGPAAEKLNTNQNAAVFKPPKVLTVNRRFNFVVVNLGIQDNVKIGDDLEIERGGRIVGLVKVEKLYESFSAAAIVKEPKEDPLKEGDVLRRPTTDSLAGRPS